MAYVFYELEETDKGRGNFIHNQPDPPEHGSTEEQKANGVGGVNKIIPLDKHVVNITIYDLLTANSKNKQIGLTKGSTQITAYLPTVKINKSIQINAPPETVSMSIRNLVINTTQEKTISLAKPTVSVVKFDTTVSTNQNVSLIPYNSIIYLTQNKAILLSSEVV